MAENCSKPVPLPNFVLKLKRDHCNDAFKKEIYGKFSQFILQCDDLEKWGFPFVDDSGKVAFLSNCFTQPKRCRCGKNINLREKDWHIDDNGCTFHHGKCFFNKECNAELYSCCKQGSNASGCVHKKHHVSTMRASWGNEFVKTQKKRRSFLPDLPNIFALDCEMVYTTVGMEVVKVTVMSVFCDVVYDAYVKPSHTVIDYNTEFSGTNEENLASVTVDLKQVQSVLLQLFDANTILVGHGLENDLLCLHLLHQKLIDTSIMFPHEKGFPFRHSLKHLAKIYLEKDIHCDSGGHDSREDAKTCLELIAQQIFVFQEKKNKMVNSCLTKILEMQANAVPPPSRLQKSSTGAPLSYVPVVYVNQAWTTSYPGYFITNSVTYPCSFLRPPPLLPFQRVGGCDKFPPLSHFAPY